MADEHKWSVFIESLDKWLAEEQELAETIAKRAKALRFLLKKVKDGRPS